MNEFKKTRFIHTIERWFLKIANHSAEKESEAIYFFHSHTVTFTKCVNQDQIHYTVLIKVTSLTLSLVSYSQC